MSAIALLVCDDSGMARKQLIRSLPADWPVNISQATNGREGLEAIRQGLGQVVLLDLTMPEMDGYQVLQALQDEGLAAKVIVVSGDVQDAAIQRVMELGALDFIKKPANPEELLAKLKAHNLLDLGGAGQDANTQPVQTPQAALAEMKVGFRDAFREITNVAMGRAAALLAKVLGVFVQLPVPNVNIFEVGELHMALADAQSGERLTAVCQGYIGDGIAGEALLIFHDSEVADMARLMKWKLDGEKAEMELMLDLSSILIGACLTAIAEQLDSHLSLGHPLLLGQHSPIEELIRVNQARWRKTLAVEISYTLEGQAIHFDLLLLFTEDSVARLSHKINYLLS